MEHLEEDLTCPVCFSLFEEPRVLPCSHTFCRRCLESVLQATLEQFPLWRALRVPLKCPSCRHMFDMPSAGLSYLPLNYSLVAIVEKYRRQQKLQRERDRAELARPPACAEHSEQPLNVYCLTDRTLVCGFCLTLGEHRSHDIESLASACAREGRALEESTRALLSDEDDSDGGSGAAAAGDDGGGSGGRGGDGDARVAAAPQQQQQPEGGGGGERPVVDLEQVPESGGDNASDGGGGGGGGGVAVAHEREEVVAEAEDVDQEGGGREGRVRRRTTSGASQEEGEFEDETAVAAGSGRDGQPCETGPERRGDGDEALARGAKEEADEQDEQQEESPTCRVKRRIPGPWARTRTQLLELEERRAEYETLVTQEAAQAEAYFAGLREELGKQQMAVMEYMEAASRRVSLGYERNIGRLRAVLDEHAAVLALAGEAQDAMLLGEPVTFLQKMHVFRERYEALCAAACAACPEPPSLGPRCRDYLVRGWAEVPLGRLGEAPLPRVPYDGDAESNGDGDGNRDGDRDGGGDGNGSGGIHHDDGRELGRGDFGGGGGATGEDGAVYGHNHHLSVILEEDTDEDDNIDESEGKMARLGIDGGWGVGAGEQAPASPDAGRVIALIDGEDMDDILMEEELATAWLPFEMEYGLVLVSAVANLRWADAAAAAVHAAKVSETLTRKVLGRGGRALLETLGPAFSSQPALVPHAVWLAVAATLLFFCCYLFTSLLGHGGDDYAAAQGLGPLDVVGLALLTLLPCLGVVAANALMQQQGVGFGRASGCAAGAMRALRALRAAGARVRAAL